jgi:hypothetical protein
MIIFKSPIKIVGCYLYFPIPGPRLISTEPGMDASFSLAGGHVPPK